MTYEVRERKRILQQDLGVLYGSISGPTTLENRYIAHVKAQLVECNINRCRGALARARAEKYQRGEQPTKHALADEKRHGSSKKNKSNRVQKDIMRQPGTNLSRLCGLLPSTFR